jgi:hypothetical protein
MSKGWDADWRALALQEALLKFLGGLHRDYISGVSLPIVGGGDRVQSCSRAVDLMEQRRRVRARQSVSASSISVLHHRMASPKWPT